MKLPFTLSVKLVFRLLLPGFVLALGMMPIVQIILEKLRVEASMDLTVSVTTLFFGWLFVVLDMPLYMIFEGRRYWPAWLWRVFVEREQRRLRRLEADIQRYRATDRNRYVEASVELRYFPINKEDRFEAAFPTRLGNLLAAYEGYSLRVYGMDSVFYWYRIWLVLDDDLRQEIDGQQALADSTLYSAAALYISAGLCALYALLRSAGFLWISHLPDPRLLAVFALLLLLAGYALYRSSLHLHAQFGEIFKSVFDMCRDKVSVDWALDRVNEIDLNADAKSLSPRERYEVAWRYLHNNKLRTAEGTLTPSELRAQRAEKQGDAKIETPGE
jgi:hypothetical protein